jgi:hypothetical protein
MSAQDEPETFELTLHDETGASMEDAIDLASDQDKMTWLTRNGKRVAAIVTAEQAASLTREPQQESHARTLTGPEMLSLFRAYAEAGVISYANPIADGRWVIGLQQSGTIELQDRIEAIAFLTGAALVVRFMSSPRSNPLAPVIRAHRDLQPHWPGTI